jgi:branched-chain amino acid aminotransferase
MSELSAKKVWHNGQLIDWGDATVHVLSHALHYGTSWFEGIRCYNTSRGSEIFRLHEHIDRLFNSAKIYRCDIPFSREEICSGILETIIANDQESCYIRPLVMRGLGSIGVDPLPAAIEVYLITWKWGAYLGADAIEKGIDVMTSSWKRAAPNTYPTMAKAGGNYLNSTLIKMEAQLQGYSEGIALDSNGFVSEGSGENIFFSYQGDICTPHIANAILPGITRDSVITLLREQGRTVREEQLPRELLYLADEVFMTGTAAEITPVRSIDQIKVGQGRRGPITKELQDDFFAYIRGDVDDRHGWLTPVKENSNSQTQAN